MKPKETKFVCDIISLVADAISTGTIPEAQDYLAEKYNCLDDEIIEHTYNVLTKVYMKEYED